MVEGHASLSDIFHFLSADLIFCQHLIYLILYMYMYIYVYIHIYIYIYDRLSLVKNSSQKLIPLFSSHDHA